MKGMKKTGNAKPNKMANTGQNDDWMELLKTSSTQKQARTEARKADPRGAVEPSVNGSRIGQMKKAKLVRTKKKMPKRSLPKDVMAGR